MAADAPSARFQRLHPLSPAFEISRSFLRLVVPGLVVLFFAAGDGHEAWYMLAFVPAVGYSLKRFLTLRYELTADHIVVREGLFFRKTRHIPYARIQNIDTVQNPLHRLLGVVEVRLETAGGKEPEAVFRVLTTQRLAEIRAGVFADRRPEPEAVPKGSAGRAAVEAERRSPTFFRMRPLDVVLFGLLSQKGLALLGGLTFLVWELNLWERFKGRIGVDLAALSLLAPGWLVAAGVFALLIGLQALTVTWAFLTLYDFHIARSGEDLSTTCGLWTRQSATLPRRRIQFLSVRESWLHRGKNGHIEIDMQPLHDFVWKLIDDIDNRDAYVVRMAISTLITFDEESDVDRILSIAKQQKKATFKTSVIALSYMCNKKARKALEGLFEHEKKTEFKEYLGKMIRKSGDFNKRSGRCSTLFK